MQSVYIRQLQPYSKSNLVDFLGEKIYEKLSAHTIVKYDLNTDQYHLDYVGVIIVDDCVINCYPKYIHDKTNIEYDFRQVMYVIKKFRLSSNDIIYDDRNMDDISFNLIPLMLFFIEDYYENGIYTRIYNIFEENGDGEIDWDRTVNNNIVYMIEDRPCYIQPVTNNKFNDIYDYFRLLHEYIITECSKYLEDMKLLDLFDITPVKLSDKSFEEFGNNDFILNRLEKELNVEFNTHKQKLLQAMYAYISNKNIFNNEEYIVLYGTTAYHNIWENVCKAVFNNKLNTQLSKLPLPLDLNETYNEDDELIKVLKKPKWILNDKLPIQTKTFIPDIAVIKGDKFIIFDAKYYDLKVEKSLHGQPGLEDIIKQYLYELAFKEFIELHGFDFVKNAFLFPTQNGEISNEGIVTLEILRSLGLEDIQIIMLPANLMYEYYLKNRKITLPEIPLK